jgi:hypothetical protein
MAETSDPRPALTPALEALLGQLIDATPAFAGLVATDLLVVGLAAHGAAVASVRSLRGQARGVVVDGRRRRVELGLRPDFFLGGDAPRRLGTLCHELLHLDPRRPGHLLDENRYARKSQRALDREAAAIAAAALGGLPPTAFLCLAHDGEVRLRQWRRRPCDETAGSTFGDRDVFDGVVRMHTPPDRRGGWW